MKLSDPKFTAKVYAACHTAADKASETIITPNGLMPKNWIELEQLTREAAAGVNSDLLHRAADSILSSLDNQLPRARSVFLSGE